MSNLLKNPPTALDRRHLMLVANSMLKLESHYRHFVDFPLSAMLISLPLSRVKKDLAGTAGEWK